MAQPKHILAIVGDFYHDRQLATDSLNRIVKPFVEQGLVQLRYGAVTELADRLKEQPDAVVLFTEDRIDPQGSPDKRWMTSEAEHQIQAYVAAGGVWIAWHSGLASYAEDGEYVNMLRGSFDYHPDVHREVIYTPVAGTALGGGGDRFGFLDEHYFVHCREEETEVFLRSESVDGESVAGWAHPYGSGKVVCITPAHREEGLMNEAFASVMRQGVAWGLELEQP